MTIKEIREETGLSQAAFAKEYHIPKRTVENWESGKNQSPPYVIELLHRCVCAELKVKYKIENVMSISDIRNLTKLSIEDFAGKYRIPARTITEWEAGRRRCKGYVLELLELCVRDDERTEYYICLIDDNDQPQIIFASCSEKSDAEDMLSFYQSAIMDGELDEELDLSTDEDRKKARAALTTRHFQAHEIQMLKKMHNKRDDL